METVEYPNAGYFIKLSRCTCLFPACAVRRNPSYLDTNQSNAEFLKSYYEKYYPKETCFMEGKKYYLKSIVHALYWKKYYEKYYPKDKIVIGHADIYLHPDGNIRKWIDRLDLNQSVIFYSPPPPDIAYKYLSFEEQEFIKDKKKKKKAKEMKMINFYNTDQKTITGRCWIELTINNVTLFHQELHSHLIDYEKKRAMFYKQKFTAENIQIQKINVGQRVKNEISIEYKINSVG